MSEDPTEEQILAHLRGEKPPPVKRIVRRVVSLLERADPHLFTIRDAVNALRLVNPDLSAPLAKMRLRLYDSLRDNDPETAVSWAAHLEKHACDIQQEHRDGYVAAVKAIREIVS